MDVLKRIAKDNPELLIEVDEIPEPPAQLNQKGAEYYYQICTMIQSRASLNKVKALCAASLASDAVQMETDPFFFEPINMTDNKVAKKVHQLAEYNHIVREITLTAAAINLSLDELQAEGIPLQTMLKKRKKELNQI
jgi:hypothetical protein